MPTIFISYRREDAEGQAGRLFNDLARHFGEASVFMDVVGIEPGRDFRRVIDQHVSSCGALLAMIGKGWVDAKDEAGRRRLEDPLDFVRLETASALKRDIPVIPVLVHGARMPRAEQLPENLTALAFRNGVELTHARWDSDVQVLIKALSPYVNSGQKDAIPTGTTAPAALSQPTHAEKKSYATIIMGSLAALAIATGGYVGYRNSTDETVVAGGGAKDAAVTRHGPYATLRRAEEVAGEYRAKGFRARASHSGDGYYAEVKR